MEWDDLLEVVELEYEKNIIMHQVGSKKDQVFIFVYYIKYHNVPKLISLTITAKNAIYNY